MNFCWLCFVFVIYSSCWVWNDIKNLFFRKDYLAIPTSLPSHQPITLGQQSLSVPDNPMRHEIARLHSFLKRECNRIVLEHLSLAGFYLIAVTPGNKIRKSNFNCPFSSLKGKKTFVVNCWPKNCLRKKGMSQLCHHASKKQLLAVCLHFPPSFSCKVFLQYEMKWAFLDQI